MEDYPEVLVSVEGHADASGIPEGEEFGDPESLSLARARSVGEHLVEIHGLDPERIRLRAWGDASPLAEPGDPRAPEMNNRVEIILGVAEDYASGHTVKLVHEEKP
jgi:flagellar motor protein MotB